jgi:anti-sigma B factor antagonist
MSRQSTVQDPPIRPRPSHLPMSWTSAQLRPGIRLVAVAGELDILTAPLLLAALQRPENIGATHLVIDLLEVDFLAAAGINALIDVARRRHPHRTHLIASRTNVAVTRIIEVTGAAEFLTTSRSRPVPPSPRPDLSRRSNSTTLFQGNARP